MFIFVFWGWWGSRRGRTCGLEDVFRGKEDERLVEEILDISGEEYRYY